MDFIKNYEPEYIEAIAKLITSLFAIISGLGTAIWAIVNLLKERRKERELKKEIEHNRIQQFKNDEISRRAERVTILMAEYSKSQDKSARAWNISALALYPDETTQLLSLLLGQCEEDELDSLQLALISIGEKSLIELIRLNKVAYQIKCADLLNNSENETSIFSSEKLLVRSQKVIVQLFHYLDTSLLRKFDFSELNLNNQNLSGMKLNYLLFKKSSFDNSFLKKTSLKKANLRGASLNHTNLTNAELFGADFTGAKGRVLAVAANLEAAILEFVEFENSSFEGAKLKNAILILSFKISITQENKHAVSLLP